MSSAERVSLIRALCALACLCVPFPAAGAEYPDVACNHWAWVYVQGVSDAEIAAGYPDGSYQPGRVVTRDQMAV